MSPTSPIVHGAAPAEQSRLRLKPSDSTGGHVDGAWWPRSTNPVVEFPALVRALHAQLGAISRISFNLDVWEPVPHRMTVDGRRVGVDGYRTFQPNTVRLTAQDGRRMSLLVIPPGTAAEQAEPTLTDAADPWNLLDVPNILGAHGIPADVARGGFVPRPR